jgi:hypothetical protein
MNRIKNTPHLSECHYFKEGFDVVAFSAFSSQLLRVIKPDSQSPAALE